MKDKFYAFRSYLKLAVNTAEIEAVTENLTSQQFEEGHGSYTVVMKSGRTYNFSDTRDYKDLVEMLVNAD